MHVWKVYANGCSLELVQVFSSLLWHKRKHTNHNHLEKEMCLLWVVWYVFLAVHANKVANRQNFINKALCK